MRYIYNLDPATITTTQPRIPGMANPQPEHLAAAGIRTIETIPIPEGYTATGATYTAHPDRADIAIETETGRLTSEIEAEREAQAESDAQAQTAADLQTYGATLGELLQRLSAFPGIIPGMGYQQIADVMDGHVAGLSGEELARASVDIQRANNLYGRLENAGITGERFWRAAAALHQ